MATKHICYETHGTCSRMIDVTCDENNIIQQVFFLEVVMAIFKELANW